MAVSGPARRAIACKLCGEMFFPASMKFHIKACEKKQANTYVQCPFCSREHRRLELAQHMLRCKSRPAGAAAPRGQSAQQAARSAADASRAAAAAVGGKYSAAAGSFGAAAPAGAGAGGEFESPGAVDARVPCSSCGRKFAPERIGVHEKACGKLSSGTKRRGQWEGTRPGAAKGGGGALLSPESRSSARPSTGASRPKSTASRPTFNADSDTSGGDGTFGAPPPVPGSRPRTAAGRSGSASKRRGGGGDTGVTAGTATAGKADWRSKHSELQKAMKMARKVAKHEREGTLDELGPIEADPNQHAGLIPCPHCGRTFNMEAGVRHIRVCANIQNKPRPPPSADGSGGIRRRGLGGGGAGVRRMQQEPGLAGGLGSATGVPGGGLEMGHKSRGEWGLRGSGMGGGGGGGRPHTSAGSGSRQRGGGYGQGSTRRRGGTASRGGGTNGGNSSNNGGGHVDPEDEMTLPGIGHPGSDLTPPRRYPGARGAGGGGPVRAVREASGMPTPSPVMMRSATAGGPGSRRARPDGDVSSNDALLEADLRGDMDGATDTEVGSLQDALYAADAALTAAKDAFVSQSARGSVSSASAIAGGAGIGRDALRDAHRMLHVAMRDVGVPVGEGKPGSVPVASSANGSRWGRTTSGRTGAEDMPEPAPMLRRPTAPATSVSPGMRRGTSGRSARGRDDGNARFGVSTVAGGFSGVPSSQLRRPGTSGSTRSGLATSASFRSSSGRSSGIGGGGGGRFDGMSSSIANATSALSPLATGTQRQHAQGRS